jgi:hypothetical protein
VILEKKAPALHPSTVNAKARRADPREYPRMLYKHRITKHEDGTEQDELLTLTVPDPVEHQAALADEWKERP